MTEPIDANQVLWILKRRWQERPLSREEMQRALQAIRDARRLKAMADQLGISALDLKSLLDWLQIPAEQGEVGLLRIPALSPSTLAAAGIESPSPTSRYKAEAWSLQRRLRAACQIMGNEVWLYFETEDPALAERTVGFRLVDPRTGRELTRGEVRLQPRGPQKWAGLRRNGMVWDLISAGPLDLTFVVQTEGT